MSDTLDDLIEESNRLLSQIRDEISGTAQTLLAIKEEQIKQTALLTQIAAALAPSPIASISVKLGTAVPQ
jgi:hypothetical protein